MQSKITKQLVDLAVNGKKQVAAGGGAPGGTFQGAAF